MSEFATLSPLSCYFSQVLLLTPVKCSTLILKQPSILGSYFTSCAFEICMTRFELAHGDWKEKSNKLHMDSKDFRLFSQKKYHSIGHFLYNHYHLLICDRTNF